jgi:hypothetical protein
MRESNFSLQPFPTDVSLPDLEITGKITRDRQILQVHYLLSGDLSEIAFLPLTATPTRQHNLWENTCFEFFLGMRNSTKYWEFNLSPSGDWNVYHFTDYRQGMEEETAITSLPFNLEMRSHSGQLDLEFDLNSIILPEQDLDFGITTVIKTKKNQVTYWALSHSGMEADFHQRDSFIKKL